jgi:hypothetical protein
MRNGISCFKVSRSATLFTSLPESGGLSRVSSADLVFGPVDRGDCLENVSQMPQNGAIFSDGIENNVLRFDSGAFARIEVAE